MAFVRTKTIKGHKYQYLVESVREGERVRQRVIKYLGKNGWGGVVPCGFMATPSKNPLKKYTKAFGQLGIKNVRIALPRGQEERGRYGSVDGKTAYVLLSEDASGFDMAHELGHAIEEYMYMTDASKKRTWLSDGRKLRPFKDELKAVADYSDGLDEASDEEMKALKASLKEKRRRWVEERPENKAYAEQVRADGKKHEAYMHEGAEQFASLFALSVTDPKRAHRLAPTASKWLMDELYQHPNVRNLMTENGWWKLGTIDAGDAAN